MASLKTKVELYLNANSKTWNSEKTNISLENNGAGDFISIWDVDGLSKPNDSKIAEYETAGNTAETLQAVLNKRASEYPSIPDQLDKIYHEGIDEWKKVIKAVKDANPKE